MSEQFYSASAGAKLFMGQSTASPLPSDAADTFLEVPLLGLITPPNKEIQTGYFSILNDTNKRSVGGKKADQESPGDLVCDWSEPVHIAMFLDLDVPGGQKRNWRIVYPDSGSRTLKFPGFLSKWTEEAFDAGQDAKEHRAAFSIAVSGAVVAV